MLPLPSQSKSFARFQSQQRISYAQLPWRRSERSPDATAPSPTTNPQRQYTPQPFRQSFVPQRQKYPPRPQQRSQIPSSSAAICDNASPAGQLSRSTGRADASSPNRLAPMPPSDLRSPVPRQPYQSARSQRVYQHAEEKGVYQLDDENFENRPEGFYTTFDPEGEEVDYSDEGFEEVIANFVGIETVCSKCSSSFPSKSQLYKHLKVGCAGAVQATPLPPTQSISPIPIIESKAIIPSLGSGLAFRG